MERALLHLQYVPPLLFLSLGLLQGVQHWRQGLQHIAFALIYGTIVSWVHRYFRTQNRHAILDAVAALEHEETACYSAYTVERHRGTVRLRSLYTGFTVPLVPGDQLILVHPRLVSGEPWMPEDL